MRPPSSILVGVWLTLGLLGGCRSELPRGQLPSRQAQLEGGSFAGTLVTDDGADVDWTQFGAGRDLVVMLGAGDAFASPREDASALARRFARRAEHLRVTVVARRQPLPEVADPRLLARDLATVIERLGLACPVLELHSAAGPVGLWLAIDRPDLVGGLVLGVSFADADDALCGLGEGWARQARQDDWGALTADLLEHTYTDDELFWWRLGFPLLFLRGAPDHPERLERLFAGLCQRAEPLEPRLSEVFTPTLVVTGGADEVVGRGPASQLDRIPGVRHVVLEGAAHSAVESERYEEELLRFVSSLDGRCAGR